MTKQATEPPLGAIESDGHRRNRRPYSKRERYEIDRTTADRLERLGLKARPSHQIFVADMETGREVAVEETVDRIVFARSVQHRAAAMALTFDAWAERTELHNLYSITLRLTNDKPRVGELKKAQQALNLEYGDVTDKLRQEKLFRPIFVGTHFRFLASGLPEFDSWDNHLHVVSEIEPEHLEQVQRRFRSHFDDVWIKSLSAERAGATINYISSWTVDHRDITNWSDEALEELFLLDGTFLRPAGEFRAFRHRVKHKVLVRHDDNVEIIDKKWLPKLPRSARGDGSGSEHVGYTIAIFDGEEKLCRILRRPRPAPAPAATLKTSITMIAALIPTLAAKANRRLLQRAGCWSRIWCYGPTVVSVADLDNPRLPRPVRRRIGKYRRSH